MSIAVCLLQLAFSLTFTTLVARTGRLSIYHPCTYYLAFHMLVFVIRPLVVHTFGIDMVFEYMSRYPTEETTLLTLSVADVGLVSFSYFCLLAGGRATEIRLPTVSSTDKRALFWVAIILLPVSFASLAYEIASPSANNLDPASFATATIRYEIDFRTGAQTFAESTAYITHLQYFLVAICLGFILVGSFKWYTYVPFLLYIFGRLSIGYGRFTVIFGLLSLLVLLMIRSGKRWFRPAYVIMGAAAVIPFSLIGRDRGFFSNILTGRELDLSDIVSRSSFAQSLDFANYEFLTYIVDVVPRLTNEFTYFTQYAELLTRPIPRLLWPDKPLGAPIRFFYLQDYGNFWSLTPSLVGDGWMSLGLPGVILTCSLVGYFCGSVYRWFWSSPTAPWKTTLYVVFLPLTVQWFRDGGISVAVFYAFHLFPAASWGMIGRLGTPTTTARAHSR